jgi:hypothetical protein
MVTRLGEFSHSGQLFTLSRLFRITIEDQMLGLLLSTQKSNVKILVKNGLGYISGGFFTNASGHPAQRLGTHAGMGKEKNRWQGYLM